MAVMSIRIDEGKRKMLKILSSLEGKTIGAFVEGLIDDYMERNKSKVREQLEKTELGAIMKLSESVFSEWKNEADDVHDDL